MTSQSTVASPISRAKLRELTTTIRKRCNLEHEPCFPVLQFLELVMPIIYPGFHLIIEEEKDMIGYHGLTCPEDKTIRIREDVYYGAESGNGRDRFTIAHEIGHYCLHSKENVFYARIDGNSVKPYMNPEWQANNFAAELLMPENLVRKMSAFEIEENCKVTAYAAEVRRKILNSRR